MTTTEEHVHNFTEAGIRVQEALLALAPTMAAYQLRMSRVVIQNIDKLIQNLRVDGDATRQIDALMVERGVRPAGRIKSA